MFAPAVFLCARFAEDTAGMSVWQQLAVAVALVFIIEGMIPFLAPARWRNMVQLLAELDDRTMRSMGLVSMLLGVVLLYLFN
jgi:uncharacterized protein YjeT (DUF2065 family)